MGDALLVVGDTVAQARAENLLEFGKALITHGLRKADERRRLHERLLGDRGDGAESDVVRIVEGEGRDLAQALGQGLAALDDQRLEGCKILGSGFRCRHDPMTTEGLDGVKQNGINILIKTIITRIFYFFGSTMGA